jgi:hypothetical protein
MSDSPNKKKLDELLAGAVELRPQPDFSQWSEKHPEAIETLHSLPAIIARRRLLMIRLVGYSTSTAAVLFVVAGAWWMFFYNGTNTAWAEVIDRLAQIRTATCVLMHHGGFEEGSKTYLEGSRVRVEDSNRYFVIDFKEGKSLFVEKQTKKARIEALKIYSEELYVFNSNPLNDLLQMKNAPAERLPDEQCCDIRCHVYRVKDVVFMGYKVPWVKLWLDPGSKLPVQIHSVVADCQSMTFNDFHWNEPFHKDLLKLVAPEGYELIKDPEEGNVSKTAIQPQAAEKVHDKVALTKADGNSELGRIIPIEEIAQNLDMLGKRIEANFKAMRSWSGAYDVVERSRYVNRNNPQYESISHAAVEFFAEPSKGRIRINNRAVEPIKIIGNDHIKPVYDLPESRWIRTPECVFRFPVSGEQPSVEEFPKIKGLDPSQPFKVVYREPPKTTSLYTSQGYIDPMFFFGDMLPHWQSLYMIAGALRGEPCPGDAEYLKKNITLHVHSTGAVTEYILSRQFKPEGSGITSKQVFSSEAGFNIVSESLFIQGQPEQTKQYTFRKEKDIFIPFEVEIKLFEDRNNKDSKHLPTQHRVFTLTKTQVNEPLDPTVFEVQSLGLKPGDRMGDRIENQMLVYDGKKFVPADTFQLPSATEIKRDAAQRAESTKNLREINMALHKYMQTKRTFPPAYRADKAGKPLLSWRVLILPYLGRDELFKQFRLDEPWDSPHNKPLAVPMPEVFKSPGSKVSGENKTNYLTVRGEKTVFSGSKGIGIQAIPDGASYTIMTVEVSDDRAVVWTRPDDFEYDEANPMKGLFGLWPDGIIVGLVDGSTRFLRSSVDPAALKAMFTRNGGEKIAEEAFE